MLSKYGTAYFQVDNRSSVVAWDLNKIHGFLSCTRDVNTPTAYQVYSSIETVLLTSKRVVPPYVYSKRYHRLTQNIDYIDL